MECGDAIRALSARDRTLTDIDDASLGEHLARCDACRRLAAHPAPALEDTVAAVALDSEPRRVDATEDGYVGRRSNRHRATTEEAGRGETINRFVVLGTLGAGGMGVVYSAYDPYLDRKVAIKVLRNSAASTEQNRTRLLREAQAMARIKHPSVIKVHEVGLHGEQVYLAMEFADAGTLRTWLTSAKRSPRAILDVFEHAGRGLAAAHAAGLVHRDFKPDNVLLASDGSVLVTDFGLVSAIGEESVSEPVPLLSRDTPLTRDLTKTGAVMGTPAYMAPEQYEGKATPQTDQFAFCVALYEALYGERPFQGASVLELSAQVISGEFGPVRNADVPGWLRRVLVRGLAAEPAARYPDMPALLAALARTRVLRRRRIVAAVALATFAAAGAATAIVLRTDRDACGDDARARSFAVWNPARQAMLVGAFGASKRPYAAASLARTTSLVDDWLTGWQAGFVEACRDTRERDEQSQALLDRRVACLDRRLDDTRAAIDALVTGGDDAVDHAIDTAAALPAVAPCADRASLLADVEPPSPAIAPEVAAIRTQLADARSAAKLGHGAASLALARPALERARKAGYTPAIGEALTAVGTAQHRLGDMAGADTLDEALRVGLEAGDSSGAVDTAAWLVMSLSSDVARYEAGEEVAGLAEAIAKRARPPADRVVDLEVATGFLLERRGHPEVARDHLQKAIDLAERELGRDHPATLSALAELGRVAKTQGKFAEARALLERVLASNEHAGGTDHPDYAHTLNELGNVLRSEGKLDDAQRAYDRALAIRVAALGPDHTQVGESYNSLGTLALERGDDDAARKALDHALSIFEKVHGKDSPELAPTLSNLGNVYEDQHDYVMARKMYERALALNERAHGPDNPSVSDVLGNLGNVDKAEKRYDDALAAYMRAQHIVEKVYGPDHPDVADALTNIATVYHAQGKLDEAEQADARALEIARKAYGPDHTRIAMVLTNFGELQYERKHYADAFASYAESLRIFEAKLGKVHPYVSYPLLGEGEVMLDTRRATEAVAVAQRALAIRIDAKQPPSVVSEARFLLAKAEVATGARARGIADAKTAAVEADKGGAPDDAANIRSWLKGK